MTPQEHINKLIGTLEGSVKDFNESIPGIQKSIANEVELFVKDLDISGDNIKVNVSNLRKIASFKDRIYRILKQSDYQDKVKEFMNTFDEVAILQNTYFESISDEFKPTKLLEEIKLQSIDATLEGLTEAGINSNLVNPIHDILLKNATTGGSWSGMVQQLRDFITTNQTGAGVLERYAKLITTDSLNQFAGQYMDAVSNDLGLEWYMYDGAIIDTSRPFCVACVDKKYIHRSEFQKVIDGDFPEFKEAGGVIYDKTDLPSGMIAGTTPSNFKVYRGGWNCEHQLVPVPDSIVPASVKAKLVS